MARLDRVLSILVDLINFKSVDASYLADKYEVSTRSIYRDIELLNMSGIPIMSRSGYQGGFYILEGFKLDYNVLHEAEWSMVLRGLQTLVMNQDEGSQKVYDKLLSILHESKKASVVDKSNEVIIDINPYEQDIRVKRNYECIQQAIISKNCLRIEYQASDYRISKRTIEPISLLYKVSNWYVYAYCQSRQDYRYFKLQRMYDLEIDPTKYQSHNYPVLDEEVFFKELVKETIVVQCDPKLAVYLEEQCNAKRIQEAESIMMSFQVPINDWLYEYVLGLGSGIEVIEPAYVRDEMKQRIKQLYELYEI